MKKLLALLTVGGVLALTTGCPPAPTTEAVKKTETTTTKEKDHGTTTTTTTTETAKELTGKVVSASGDKISFKEDSGKEHMDVDAKGAKVMLDGKAATLADLKADDKVTVTMKGDAATKVDATAAAAPVVPPPTKDKETAPPVVPPPPKDKETTPAPEKDKATTPEKDKTTVTTVTTEKEATESGKVVSVEKDKLTVSVDGKDKTVMTGPDTKVTIDGKEDKLENVKKDNMVTVTTKGDMATKIEAKTK